MSSLSFPYPRVLVIGASGLVGGAFHARLARTTATVAGTSHTHARAGLLPFTLGPGTAAFIATHAPTLVVLASAMTHVDRCESEPDEAWRRNVTETVEVADACARVGAALLYFSTDYVFDGVAGPYAEDAPVRPLSVYGRSKLAAEQAIVARERTLTLRITNVFDIGFEDRNFVHRCVTSFRDHKPLVVPADQWATPAYATALADQTVGLLEQGALLAPGTPRLLHAGCDDVVSRGTLARRVALRLNADPALIVERPTADLEQTAPRPLRGGLKNDHWKRLLGVTELPLDAALDDCLPRMRRLYDSRD